MERVVQMYMFSNLFYQPPLNLLRVVVVNETGKD